MKDQSNSLDKNPCRVWSFGYKNLLYNRSLLAGTADARKIYILDVNIVLTSDRFGYHFPL